MSASPAVILTNIPSFLTINGRSTALHVLGSKTGVEVGACYWKLHPILPMFMVVFKNRVDRDNWFNTSMKLKEMVEKGVAVSIAWYSRDNDDVLEEQEGVKFDKGGGRSNLGGGSYMKLLEERDKNNCQNGRRKDNKNVGQKIVSLVGDLKKTNNHSVDNMSALSAEIEDLDKLATSKSIFAQKNKLNNLAKTKPPPPTCFPMKTSCLPSLNAVLPEVKVKTSPISNYNLRPANAHKLTINYPILSQDFSVPPPPLRLPLHVKAAKVSIEHEVASPRADLNSNILARLEEAVKENLENDKENQIVRDTKNISTTVAESWRPAIENLENIYEAVLSDASLNVLKVAQDLSEIYDWEGSRDVTREQALEWTKEFLVKAGMKAGSDMEESFSKFLITLDKQFRISSDEVKFIMQRNGLDMVVICKAFSENSNSVGFRNFIKINVNISGQLLSDFSGVFLEFFRSRVNQGSKNSSRKSTTSKQCGLSVNILTDLGSIMNVKVDVPKIKEVLAKKDIKGMKQLNDKMKKLSSCNDALEKKNLDLMKQISKQAEIKLIKEEFHEKLRAANQENKLLRARNSSLQVDVGLSKVNLDKAKSRKLEIVSFLDKFDEAVVREDIAVVELMLVEVPDDEEIGKLKNSLRSLIKSQELFKEDANIKKELAGCGDMVNAARVLLVLTEDNMQCDNSVSSNMVVFANKDKLVSIEEVEIAVGRKATGLKYRQGKGKGWRNLKVEEGLAHPPSGGWGNREFMVVAQEDESAPAHLGQGCVSTPGHSRRQESSVREGPMFPPHVGGPRICAD